MRVTRARDRLLSASVSPGKDKGSARLLARNDFGRLLYRHGALDEVPGRELGAVRFLVGHFTDYFCVSFRAGGLQP